MVTKLGPLCKVKLLKNNVDKAVVRSPEKAGVGGSTPSLAPIILKKLAAQSRNSQPTIQPTIRSSDPQFLTAPSPGAGESCFPAISQGTCLEPRALTSCRTERRAEW